MSRIPQLNPADMDADQKRIHDALTNGPHGHVVGPFPAWLHSPKLAEKARGVSAFIRFESSLPAHLREIAILICGRYWRAEFEYWAHAAIARKAGVEEAIIKAIARGQRPDFQDGQAAVLYDFCTELFENRRVSDATYQRGIAALGLQQVVEMVATIGYYSMVSLTLNAFEVPLPEGAEPPFPEAG